ncbi:MAG: flagellar protein FliS [Planctomycetota bacterium]|nr:flagellar protein FliS [Planctomycetota bacterium]
MSDPDVFLLQEVESASPAKLRFLLIRKAVGLCQVCADMWQEKRYDEAAAWMIRVRDILGELLDGVTDRSNPAATGVVDLYIYLLKTVLVAEQSHDVAALKAVTEILEIELETWNSFVLQESGGSLSKGIGAPHAVEATIDGCLSMLNLYA